MSEALFGLSARSGVLPAEFTSFVARRRELSELKGQLAHARLVSMVGAGGVGKTRLAVRAAAELRTAIPDAIWFVDLSALHDPALLGELVTNALRIGPVPGKTAIDAVAEFIGEDRVLLILDNCEHLLAGAAELVSALLGRCLRLRIIATSREPLGVAGERVFAVGPLQVPERGARVARPADYGAVALFVERAREVFPALDLGSDALQAIGEICYRLDGLPLAIELAAMRLRALTLTQLLERLTDPYRLLTGGSRTAPERQRTLRASIEWSYDLCTPAEQAVWVRLSTFAAGCEIDAAEAVCSGGDVHEADVLDILQSLVEKSIVLRVERDDVVWYRMLETIHEYGTQRLAASGEAELVERRCRRWYEWLLGQAEADWVSPRQRYWLARMYREIDNLRELLTVILRRTDDDTGALRLILPAWRICWWALGRVDELRIWLDRAIAASPDLSLLRGRALIVKCYLDALQGRADAGAADLEAGRRIATRLADHRGLALIAATEGVTAELNGDLGTAVQCFEAALDELGDHPELGRYLNVLAQLAAGYDGLGELDRSADYRDRAIAISEKNEELFERGYLYLVLGASAWARGDIVTAERLVRDCLRLKRELGDPVGAALAVQMLAITAMSSSDAVRSSFLLGVTQTLWHRAGAVAASFPTFLHDRETSAGQARETLGRDRYELEFARGVIADPDESVAVALGERQRTSTSVPARSPLTAREKEVAALVAQGMTNKEIAAHLVVAVRTAEGHVERVRNKLGLTSRTQIVAWVLENPELAGGSS